MPTLNTSSRKCLFRDDQSSWCFDLATPVMKLGWSIDSAVDTGKKWWKLAITPTLSTNFAITSLFDVSGYLGFTNAMVFRFMPFNQKLSHVITIHR
jgi:hypothetical protein